MLERRAFRMMLLSIVLFAPVGRIAAQQGGPAANGAREPGVSAELAVLHGWIGDWKARVEVSDASGEKSEKYRAEETVRLCCGGLFVLTDLQAKGKDADRGGRGILGYDAERRRYILSWAGNLSNSLAIGEGEYDEAGNAITFHYDRPDGTGGTERVSDRFAWMGEDQRTRTISIVSDDGSTRPSVAIEYRRK